MTAEEALIKASKVTQEKRNKIVEKHLEKISRFLDSEDAVPTQTQVVSRTKKQLKELVDTVYSGKKPSIEIGGYGGSYDYPLKLVLIILQSHVRFILDELEARDISPKEIAKKSSYHERREKGSWSKKEIQNIPMDWVKSAIILYYTANENRGKDDNSCFKEKGVISAKELKESEKIIKLGNVQEYLYSLGYGGKRPESAGAQA